MQYKLTNGILLPINFCLFEAKMSFLMIICSLKQLVEMQGVLRKLLPLWALVELYSAN